MPPSAKGSAGQGSQVLVAKSAPPKPGEEGQRATGSAAPAAALSYAGKKYGCWNVEKLGSKPRCLHLFSGPQREGDLVAQLAKLGWAVCSCDIEQPTPTNL